jgi:hypothetical protein
MAALGGSAKNGLLNLFGRGKQRSNSFHEAEPPLSSLLNKKSTWLHLPYFVSTKSPPLQVFFFVSLFISYHTAKQISIRNRSQGEKFPLKI